MKKLSVVDIENFIRTEINPMLAKQMRIRRELSDISVQWGGLSFAATLFVVLITNKLSGLRIPLFPVVFFVPFVVVYFVAKKMGLIAYLKEYHATFKFKIVKKVLELIDPQIKFNPMVVQFPYELYNSCGLFTKKPDVARAEDHIVGSVKGVPFESLEIHTQEKQEYKDSKGRRRVRYVTIFRGLLFCAQFNKTLNSRTLVLTDKHESLLGFLSRGAQRIMNGNQLVELESPEFEKHFKVLSSNQVEARYILSSTFMQKILDLKFKHKQNIQLAFQDAEVIVAIPMDKNLFEPPMGILSVFTAKQEDYREQIETYLQDFQLILELIEDLDLNNKIWVQPKAV